MVQIDVMETSGVDHPAHMAEGWMVCKSATKEQVEGLFGPLLTEGTPTMATQDASATEPTVESLAKQLEDMTKQRDEEKARADAAEAQVTKAADPAPAADDDSEELLKALPEPVRLMLKKSQDDAAAAKQEAAEAMAKAAKAENDRLDDQARAEYSTMFKAIAVDTNELAPAMRRLAIIDADLHKSVLTALKASDEQAATGVVLKTVGRPGDPAGGTALELLKAKADAIRTADPSVSEVSAFAKAATENPDLYDQYQTEKAGN